MISQGKIAFKTCTHMVYIPASYLRSLSLMDYGEEVGDHKSLEDAVDYWLLTEILNTIGQHSIL